MIESRKFSPGATVAALGIVTASMLGAEMVKSFAGERETKAIKECIEYKNTGNFSEYGYDSCRQRAIDSNNVAGLTGAIEFLGGGVLLLTCGGVAYNILTKSHTEIYTNTGGTEIEDRPPEDIPTGTE